MPGVPHQIGNASFADTGNAGAMGTGQTARGGVHGKFARQFGKFR